MLGKQAQADETLDQLALGLFTDQFVARVAPPEIDAGDLKKLAGSVAEELDQRGGIGTFRGLSGKLQEELLKSLVGIGQEVAVDRGRRIASGHVQNVTRRHRIFAILTSD